MGHFRTDDDYMPVDGNDYPVYNPGYGGNDNPEMGDYSDDYGNIKKPNILSRIFKSSGKTGREGISNDPQNSNIIEKVLFVIYLIVMVFVVINIKTVLDFLFYTTVTILQYAIMVFVVVLLIYVFCKYVLHMRIR